jgi:hypothetical protein
MVMEDLVVKVSSEGTITGESSASLPSAEVADDVFVSNNLDDGRQKDCMLVGMTSSRTTIAQNQDKFLVPMAPFTMAKILKCNGRIVGRSACS